MPKNRKDKHLTEEEKKKFIRDGYIVLRGAIGEKLVEEALSVIDEAYENGDYEMNEKSGEPDVPKFSAEVAKHKAIGRILDRSNVVDAMEDLLGEDNVQFARRAQIAFRPQDENAIKKGLKITDQTPPLHYHIDGGAAHQNTTGSPFTLLAGVCLSPGQDVDELRGQFTVWPGSHRKLHKVVRQRYEEGLLDGKTVFGGKDSKPDIGPSKRLLTKPGDVVLSHQRLGHSGGINVHTETRKNLYFRVSHKGHDERVEEVIKGPLFLEYEGLHDLVEESD